MANKHRRRVNNATAYRFYKKQTRELKESLAEAVQGLDDWTATYAPEFCGHEMVQGAQNRLREYGTIAYIANIVSKGHTLLRKYK